MAVSSAAQKAEAAAFARLSKKLGKPTAFAEPAGFETAFPDFGFRLFVGGKKVDLHIEYKADAKAQMGSMRDWAFDGTKFSTPDSSNDEKSELIDIMNSSRECVMNGKRLLNDFKQYSDKGIKKIYSGMMTIEKDKEVRRAKLVNFANNTKNYQLAKIDDKSIGQKIIQHYKHKFAKSMKKDADYSLLLMMIDDQMWYIDSKGNLSGADQQKVADMLGGKIPVMSSLKAQLEVRIQPRGLSAPNKPVSIDVMASFRLSGAPPSGLKVI